MNTNYPKLITQVTPTSFDQTKTRPRPDSATGGGDAETTSSVCVSAILIINIQSMLYSLDKQNNLILMFVSCISEEDELPMCSRKLI